MASANTTLAEHVLSSSFWRDKTPPKTAVFAAFVELAKERPDVFAFESAQQIAKRCQTSQSSVVRCAQLAGFDGILEMKKTFQLALKRKFSPMSTPE